MKKPRFRNILLILLAGLCLLGAEGYFILRAGLFNDRLVAFGLSMAHRALLGRIEVRSVEGDPLRGLVIRDFRLTGADGQLIAAAGEATVNFDILRMLRLRSPVAVRVENAFFHAEKRDGSWNLLRLRRPRPPRPKGPLGDYPPFILDAEIINLHLIISPSLDRIYDSQVRRTVGRLSTNGRTINFTISDFVGVLAQPALGINGLTGEGSARGAERGWDLHFKNCRAVTASSVIELKTGFYQTGASVVAAEFNRLEVAPDVLSVFWPNSGLAIPVRGTGSVTGTTARPAFTIRISSQAGDLNAIGYYDRVQNHLDLKGDLFDFSLAEFLVKPIQLENLTGGFTLTWEHRRPAPPETQPGTTTAPSPSPQPGGTAGPSRIFRAHLELLDFSYPGINSFPGIAEFEFIDNDWTLGAFSDVPGANFAAYINGSSKDPRPLAVHAILRDVNPRIMRSGWPDGRLVGALKIEGHGTNLNNFNGSAEVQLDAGMLYGYTLSAADLKAAVATGRIVFHDSSVTGEGLSIQGRGWIEPTRQEVPFSFDLDAVGGNPQLVATLTNGAVDAPGATARLTLSGDRSGWRAHGAASASAIKTGKAETAAATADLDLSTRAGLIQGKVNFHTSQLTIPAANFKTLKVPPLSVALAAEIPSSPLKRPTVRFKLGLDSAANDYAMNSAGMIVAGGSSDWRLDLASLALRVAGRAWALTRPALVAMDPDGLLIQDLKLNSGRERLAADGRVGRGDLNLALSAEQFDLKPWAQTFQYGDSVGGILDLSLAFSGAPDAPRLKGAIAVGQPLYRQAHLDRIAGDLAYAGGRFTFALSGGSPSSGRIEATGFVPLSLSLRPGSFAVRNQDPVEVAIKAGEVDAGLLNLIFPWLTEISGRMSVDAKLLGSIQSPSWNGSAKLEQVAAKAPDWGLQFQDVAGNAEIVNNHVAISSLTGRSGEGKASVTGSLELAAFKVSDINLAITTKNFRAMNTPDLSAAMDAELTFRGSPEFPKLSGKLTFTELAYRPPPLLQYQGTNWEKEDPTIRVKGEDLGEPGQSPWLDRGDLNIRVNIPTNIGLLRSSELNLRFGGDLVLKKPPGGFFLIFGKIESREGWLIFQGKPFRVEHGNFVFPAIPAIDPDIDILASYRAGSYTTYLKLGGTLSVPTLEVYSEPALEQADVLSVILFGRPGTPPPGSRARSPRRSSWTRSSSPRARASIPRGWASASTLTSGSTCFTITSSGRRRRTSSACATTSGRISTWKQGRTTPARAGWRCSIPIRIDPVGPVFLPPRPLCHSPAAGL